MKIELLIAILTSAALFGFVQFLINRRDSRNDILNNIKLDIEDIRNYLEKDKADRARRNILEASDDCTNNRTKHGKEWWDELISDIDFYETYCEMNEDYKNNKAVMAIENLKHIYKHLLDVGFN